MGLEAIDKVADVADNVCFVFILLACTEFAFTGTRPLRGGSLGHSPQVQ